jgi:HK97 family phage portal protein
MLLARYLSAALDPFDDRAWTRGPVVHMEGGVVASGEGYKVATVWRAVNVLAASVAVLPVSVFRRLDPRGKEQARDHPLHNLLRLMPNRMQTSYRWRHQMMGHVVLTGNYYAHKVMAGEQLLQLWPLDPERMRVENVRRDGTIDYVYTKRNGQPEPLTQDDVLHVRGFSHDGIVGISVIEAMRELTAQAIAAQRQRTAFLRNELRPSATITHPKELQPASRESLEKSLQAAFGGPNKAGRLVLLDEAMEIKPFSISSRDAQFVESENFRVAEFLRFIGVPGVLVGYADKTATYASAEAFFQSFKDHNVFPWTRNIEQELTVSLLGGDQDETFVEFNLDAMLRPDSAARSSFYRVMVELGIYTRNEVREFENKNPLPGLDEPLTPKNMDVAGAEPQPARRRPAPPPDDEDEDEDEDDEDDEGEQDDERRNGGGKSPARSVAPPPVYTVARIARAGRVVRAAVLRILRKERLAIAGGPGKKGAAERFAADPQGWNAWLGEFYSEHVQLVREVLAIDAAAAESYCVRQCEAVLNRGVAAIEDEASRGAELERLALEA